MSRLPGCRLQGRVLPPQRCGCGHGAARPALPGGRAAPRRGHPPKETDARAPLGAASTAAGGRPGPAGPDWTEGLGLAGLAVGYLYGQEAARLVRCDGLADCALGRSALSPGLPGLPGPAVLPCHQRRGPQLPLTAQNKMAATPCAQRNRLKWRRRGDVRRQLRALGKTERYCASRSRGGAWGKEGRALAQVCFGAPPMCGRVARSSGAGT